jgi:hypothetical protein
MNLHANAALSLKGRRELCLAVVERERTLTAAAEAAGVSVRCARKWVGRYRSEGEAGLRDRSSAPRRIPHRTSEQRVEAIAAVQAVAVHRPGDRRVPRDAAVDRVGDPDPDRDGQARTSGPGAGGALRAPAAG